MSRTGKKTERPAEWALRETEKNLRKQVDYLNTLLHNMNEIFYTYDANGIITFGNQKACDCMGYKMEELVGKHVLDFVPPEDKEKIKREIMIRIERGESGSYQQLVIRRDGTRRLFRLNASPICEEGKIVGGMVLADDITERAQAEEALRVSEEKFSKAFHSTAQTVTITTVKEGRYIDVNDTYVTLTGYTAEESIGRKSSELGIWENDEARSVFIERLKRERSVKNYELRFRNRWGDNVISYLSADIIVVDGEELILAITTDITHHKRMEEDLAAEKERLAVTLGSIAEGVIAADEEGNIVLINEVAETLIGWPTGEAVGQKLTDVFRIIGPDSAKPTKNLVKTILKTKKVLELDNYILMGRDDQNLLVNVSAAPMKDLDGRVMGIVLVFRDVTEKNRIDQELQKASKLESLGVLAGGIAHDFNNLLTIILGNTTLIHELAAGQDSIMNHIIEIEKGIAQARSLTQQLLTFAKGGDPVKQTVYLSELVRNTTMFTLSGANVRCEFSLPPYLWPADIDEGQIGQVINNLVLNATQAMPNGGLISVKAENVEIKANSDLPLPAGRYIKLSIQDRGVGIQEGLKSKIFDPYFTTKINGSGLGLATAYSIIKNHKGYIGVDSVVGEGSTFNIYLPATRDKTENIQSTERETVTGHGRILVMDDDRQVLDVLGRMLAAIGYETDMTADGLEALDKYAEAVNSNWGYDAVILDLTVPGGMGGGETIKGLRQIDSGVKAIVSSGYSNDKIMAEYEQWGFRGVLPKPYGIRDLSEVLNRVIHGDAAE